MYSQIYDIAQKFGITPNSIGRLKYFYILHCGRGVYSLCAARPSAEKTVFLHSLKEGLIKNGFCSVDRYITALDGLPYVECDGIIYTMTRFNGMNELDFADDALCLRAAEAIGAMHRAAAEIKSDEPLLKKYASGTERLTKLKRINSSKKYPADMDLLFRRMYKAAYGSAKYAAEKLAACGFDGCRKIYIHNSLKEDNLICFRGKIYIIDWDNAMPGSPAEDTAFFVKRYIRKKAYCAFKSRSPYLRLNDILSAYNSKYKFSPAEKEAFYALLKFPSRYIDVMEDYYKKQRSFTPASIARKAQEIAEQWDFAADYASR